MFKKCIICLKHFVETSSFTGPLDNKIHPIRSVLTCESENIIYLLFCVKCKNAQYVGETQGSLRKRFYTHRSDISRNKGFCTHVISHFNGVNHSVNDLRCHPIEQVYKKIKEYRRERERFWIDTLGTLYPSGLNAIDY